MPAETQDANPAAGDGSVRYYLVISNLDGGSAFDRFVNSFEVSGFSFDLENSSGLKTDFNPLEVDLSMGTATDELTQMLLKGSSIQRVRLVAVGSGDNPPPFYDLRLGDAIIRGLTQNADGSSHLAIDYSKVTLTTLNNDGSLDTHGWDRIGNGPSNEQLSAPGVGDEDGDASLGVSKWYLTIDGMDGGSRDAGHEGAFVLKDFDFDLALPGTIGAGGAGSGKAQITPIDMAVEWGSAADEILDAIAKGEILSSARIVGVDTTGGSERTAYDLRLGDIALRDGSLRSGVNSLSIDYKLFSLTTSNSLGAEETVNYDRSSNTTGTTQLAETLAVLDNAKTGGGPATYYIKIDGMDGGSTAKGHKGAFEISGLDLNLHNTGTFTTGGGGGTGKTVFAPLDITLNPGSDTTRLLEYISTGKHIRSVQITSDQGAGDNITATGFDLRLANVQFDDFMQTSSGDTLSLGYGSYTVTTAGSDGTKETSGWDIADNKALTTGISAPKPADHKASGGSDNLGYYLLVGGVDGGSNSDRHAGAFEIKSFSLDIESESSNGIGKVTFGQLELDLKLGSNVEDLVSLAATGKRIKTIELVGDSRNGAPATVYDLRLGTAQLTSMIDQNTGLDHLSFSFAQYSLATLNASGKRDVYGFDVVHNTKLDAELDPANKTGHNGAGGNLDYYMTIDGLDGGSTSDEHTHSFKLSDLDFKFSRADGVGTADIKLNIGTAGDELMQLIATGKSVKSIEIAGEHHGPDASGDPYDLRLNSVRLTAIHQDAQGNDILSLQFSKFSLTTEDAKGDPHTSGYDGVKGMTVTKPVTAAHAADEEGAAGGNETYHLLLDGLNGGDTHVGREGAFSIADFDFDIAATIANVGGGGGTGKTTFQPLHIALQSGSAADELLLKTASGEKLAAAEIVGDLDAGDGNLRTFDLRLSDVLISGYSQSGTDTLTLSFGALSLTTTSEDDKGTTHSETYAFDLGTQTGSDQPLPAPVPDI